MKMKMGLVVSYGMILGWANHPGHLYVNEPKTTDPGRHWERLTGN